MQDLCMAEKRRSQRYEEMLIERFRGLRGICSMQRMERNWPTLVSRPEWKRGGTVEPPCDFQLGLSGMSVFIGIPP